MHSYLWPHLRQNLAASSVALLLVTALAGCATEPALYFDPRAQDGGANDTTASAGLSDEAYAQVSQMYDRLLELARQRAAFMCTCETDTEAELNDCVRQVSAPPPPPVVECSKQVYAADERSVEPIRCELEGAEAYLSCIQQSTCSDFEHITDCIIEGTLGRQQCESLPWDLRVLNEEACLGIPRPEAFECANGQLIDARWRCDSEADCDDASDEQQCAQ